MFRGDETDTTIVTKDYITDVTYNGVVVVSINHVKQQITFDTRRRITLTTVRRINQTCAMFSLPYQAYIRNMDIFIGDDNGIIYRQFPATVPRRIPIDN